MLPASNCNILSFIISSSVALAAYIIAGLIVEKYKMKKTRILACLSGMVLSLATAVASDPVCWGLAQFKDEYPWLQVIGKMATPLPFALSALANIFLVLFMQSVFFKKNRKPWLYIFASVEAFVAVVTPVMGFMEQDILPMLFLHLGVSLFLYILQWSFSFKVRKRIKKMGDHVSYNGMTFIGLSGIFLCFTLTSFIMQELVFEFPALENLLSSIEFIENGCSYFISIGWTLAAISALMLYIGYVMPDWLRRRWESKNVEITSEIEITE